MRIFWVLAENPIGPEWAWFVETSQRALGMPVQTLECHIATVLMKRFLDGETLPPEMVADMERHVKACPGCQEILKGEKHSIEEVLDGSGGPKGGLAGLMAKMGMKPATAGGFATAYPTEALVAASRASYRTPAPGISAFKNPKVVFLSLGLAVVLILMSTLLKDPTMLLGGKAMAGAPAGVTGDKPEDKEAGTEDPKSEGEGSGDEAAGAAHGEDSHANGEAHGDAHGETSSADGAAHGAGDEGSHSAEPEKKADHSNEPAGEGHGTPVEVHGDGHGKVPEGMVKVGNRDDYHAPEKAAAPSGSSEVFIVGGTKSGVSGSGTRSGVGGGSKGSTAKSSGSAKSGGGASSGGAKRSSGGTRRPSGGTSSSKSKASGSGKGGIRVYDQNGNVIH